MDFDKAHPVDEIYAKYPDGALDYESVRRDLADLNTRISNNFATTAGSVLYDSSAKVNRNHQSLTGTPAILNRTFYYGIVLEVKGYNNRNIYIDVPPFNNKTLVHIDNIAKAGVNLEDYEDMIFFPSANSTLCNPVIGGIAKVMLPDNYPRHINSNSEDAIYVEMYAEQKIIQSDRKAPAFTNLPFTVPASVAYGMSSEGSLTDYSTDWSGEPATLFSKEVVDKAFKECDLLDPRMKKMIEFYEGFYNLWRTPNPKTNPLYRALVNNKAFTDRDLSNLNDASKMFGIDPDLLLALSIVETTLGLALNTSRAGATGLYQMMPGTFVGFIKSYPEEADVILQKLTGVTDKASNGKVIEVLTKTSEGHFRINDAFTRDADGKTWAGAVDLGKSKYRDISPYMSALGLKKSWIPTSMLDGSIDIYLLASGYNGGPGMVIGRKKGSSQLGTCNYRDINKWTYPCTGQENSQYMIKFGVAYKLIKCARKIESGE
jgi:hypothetical protein